MAVPISFVCQLPAFQPQCTPAVAATAALKAAVAEGNLLRITLTSKETQSFHALLTPTPRLTTGAWREIDHVILHGFGSESFELLNAVTHGDAAIGTILNALQARWDDTNQGYETRPCAQCDIVCKTHPAWRSWCADCLNAGQREAEEEAWANRSDEHLCNNCGGGLDRECAEHYGRPCRCGERDGH